LDNIQSILSDNIKRIKEQRKLSLEQLSKLTGVSKSMLGQIERGEVNPTISILWKIAGGLKLPFSELIARTETDFELIEKDSARLLSEDNGRFRNYAVFSYSESRPFETYYLEIEPGSHLEAEPHPAGTQEFITVFDGTLQVSVGDTVTDVAQGCSLRFLADRAHAYRSIGAETCLVGMVIYYPQ